ncbi:MAG: hypothetical protein R3C53_00635 [Pirellulaceae bacterium]
MTRNHLPNLKFKLGTGNFFDERNIGRLDAYANRALELIDNAFGRKAWPSPQASVPAQPIGATTPPPLSIVTGPGSQPGSQPGASGGRNDELIDLLKTRPILKLIGELNKHQDRETLEDLVGDSSNTGLFYQVEEALEDQHGTFNQQSILNRKSIVLYLFVYAQRVEGLSEPAAIARWIADDEDGGIREIYRAVVDLAVRDLVQRKRIEVGVRAEFDTYARLQIENSQFSFLDGVFEKSIENLVKDYAFDNNNFKLIDDTAAKLGILLSTTQRQFLTNNYIKNSTILSTLAMRAFFHSSALNQFSNRGISFLREMLPMKAH